eukprot:1145038-Pelagomonas_calceolata.AAC.4
MLDAWGHALEQYKEGQHGPCARMLHACAPGCIVRLYTWGEASNWERYREGQHGLRARMLHASAPGYTIKLHASGQASNLERYREHTQRERPDAQKRE